jgi:hypothetical protein
MNEAITVNVEKSSLPGVVTHLRQFYEWWDGNSWTEKRLIGKDGFDEFVWSIMEQHDLDPHDETDMEVAQGVRLLTDPLQDHSEMLHVLSTAINLRHRRLNPDREMTEMSDQKGKEDVKWLLNRKKLFYKNVCAAEIVPEPEKPLQADDFADLRIALGEIRNTTYQKYNTLDTLAAFILDHWNNAAREAHQTTSNRSSENNS